MNKIPTTSQASLSKGLWFTFRDGNREITAYGSFTGKEHVFVNDNLISKKRTLGLTSTHRFIFEKDTYEVVFCLQIQRMDVRCQLIKNGICIECLKFYYTLETIEFLLISGFIGFASGVLIGFFRLPIWLSAPALICLSLMLTDIALRKVVIDKADM